MRFTINNFDFEILLVDRVTRNDDALGVCYKDQMKIWISKHQSDSRMLSAIKHELTHAYIYAYGFDQVRFDEEVMCDFIETYAEQIVKDAKKIYKSLNK